MQHGKKITAFPDVLRKCSQTKQLRQTTQSRQYTFTLSTSRRQNIPLCRINQPFKNPTTEHIICHNHMFLVHHSDVTSVDVICQRRASTNE